MGQPFNVKMFIFVCIICQALSVVLSKLAADSSGQIIFMMFNSYYLGSIIMLGVQSIFWQLVLKNSSLSTVYPYMTLVNVVLLFLGYIVFGENISLNNLIGVVIILVGILIINKSTRKKQ